MERNIFGQFGSWINSAGDWLARVKEENVQQLTGIAGDVIDFGGDLRRRLFGDQAAAGDEWETGLPRQAAGGTAAAGGLGGLVPLLAVGLIAYLLFS